MAMGRHSDARMAVDKALASERTPAALLQAGLLEIEAKQFEAGRRFLEEVLQHAPANLEALNAIAHSFAREGRQVAGVERLRKQAVQFPKSAAVQFVLGSWLERMGDVAGASASFSAALAADAAYSPAAIALARMKMLQGEWSNAQSDVAKILSRDPGNTGALLALGMIEEHNGKHDAAVKAYRAVLQIEPANITALNNLIVRLCENPATTDEAVLLAQNLKQSAPDSLEVDDTVGWAYYKHGQHSLAVRHLERAANAKNAQATYHLAMAYFKAGQRNLGQKTLAAALQLNPGLPEAKLAQALAKSTP